MKKLVFNSLRLVHARSSKKRYVFSYGKLKSLFPKWVDQLQKRISSTVNVEPLTLIDKGTLHGSWHGTPLPLLPNIRQTDVKVGEYDPQLEEYGIKKKTGGEIVLYPGPNKKMNRYLDHQYTRAIKVIGGELVRVPTVVLASTPASATPTTASFKTEIHWSIIWKDIVPALLSPESRKDLARRARTYWAIALQLLCHSHSFRTALIGKVLGKKERWFHRDKTLVQLFRINDSYSRIVRNWKQVIPVRRCWIPQPGGKWRPLGIAPVGWRVYTRGLNNFLEVFLANGWPSNQHAYTTGRGVHTAWKVILSKVIGSRDIWEADFSAFFNSVKLESVSRHLARFGIPKYIAAHLINLCASDVTNVTYAEMLTYDESWKAAWPKYEYIHKFRQGWRCRGLVQGFSLAPVLSVLTLVAFDAMVKEVIGLGAKVLYYADDLLCYGNLPADFVEKVTAALKRSGIGAEFALAKCSWVKRNGTWLTSLKFVGLLYNPFTNLLAAKTRAGATLPLFVGSARIQLRNLHKDIQDRISSLMCSDPAIHPVAFYDDTMAVIESVKKSLESHIGRRLETLKYGRLFIYQSFPGWRTLCDLRREMFSRQDGVVRECEESGVPRLLYSTLFSRAKPIKPDEDPWISYKLALTIAQLLDKFGPLAGEYEDETRSALSWWGWDKYVASLPPKGSTQLVLNSPPLGMSLLSALHIPPPPVLSRWLFGPAGKSVTPITSQMDLEIPRGIGSFSDPVHPEIPVDSVNILANLKWNQRTELSGSHHAAMKIPSNASLNVSVLDWRNTWETPLFNMLIARMFSDSWAGNSAKQDFKLSSEEDSLTDCLNKFGNLTSVLGSSLGSSTPLSVFNSTSISSFITTKLMDHWSRGRKPSINSLWEKSYFYVYDKIGDRRTGWTSRKFIVDPNTGKRVLKSTFFERAAKDGFANYSQEALLQVFNQVKSDPIDLDGLRLQPWVKDPTLLKSLRPDQLSTLSAFPLSPFDNMAPAKPSYRDAVGKKFTYFSGKGLQWETLHNSTYSEFELEPMSSVSCKRPARTDWFTWAPYLERPRRRGKPPLNYGASKNFEDYPWFRALPASRDLLRKK